MFFVTVITRKYGRNGGTLVRCLLKTTIKLAKTKNRLKFLLNCRRCKLIPKCLNYKVKIWLHSSASRREQANLEHRHKIRMISLVISDTKRMLEQLKNRKHHLCIKVRNALQHEDWEEVHKMVETKACHMYIKTKETEVRKLDELKRKKLREFHQQPEWIENTTNIEIPDYLERTLLLGPNFNVQNKRTIPYVQFVADVENAIRKKPEADNIRTEVSTIVSNHINYQSQPRTKENEWIHQDIMRSRRFLKEQPELYVTKADKGNKIVFLSATEYHQKMVEMVSDISTYRKLRDNPTNKVLKKLNMIIEG